MIGQEAIEKTVPAIIAEVNGMRPGDAVAVLMAVIDLVLLGTSDPLAGWYFVDSLVQARIAHNDLIDDCAGSA
jgi:hypothetical protein